MEKSREKSKVTDEQRRERFAKMPVCNEPRDVERPCRFQVVRDSEYRCGAAGFCATNCPYIGKILPLREVIEEEEKEKESSEMIQEAPPEVDA